MDTTICLEVDGLATGSGASEKSRSLELLLTLHTLVGAGQSSRREGGGRGDSRVAPGLANGSGTSLFQPRASTAPCI